MRTVTAYKTDLPFDNKSILELNVNGEEFIFGIKGEDVRSFSWNGDMFERDDMKHTKIIFIICWLITCRDMREVYAAMIKFVLK
jgi:hypothetical protein